MNFVAIDFETANEKISSVCQVGLAIVKNGQVVDKLSWLVRPPELIFNRFNTYVHGIRLEDVENEPEFNEIWPEIKVYLEGNTVIAHNASFDILVLRSILDIYELEYPSCDYCCSVKIAQKIWLDLRKHGLKSLSAYLGIEFNHHDAAEDAFVSAQIVLAAAKKINENSFASLLKSLEIRPGRLFPGGFVPIHQLNQFNLKKTDISKLDPEHPFFSQTMVFSGGLQAMDRNVAMQKIADVGGICAASVNEHTNILIIGDKIYGRYQDNLKTGKILKAEELIERGYSIDFITEKEFLTLLKTPLFSKKS